MSAPAAGAPAAPAEAGDELQQLRHRLERSELARNRLREAAAAGLAANAELQKEAEALRAAAAADGASRARAEKERDAAAKHAADAEARAAAATAASASERARAEELSRRVAALEAGASEAAALRARVAVLEHSLALVREAAGAPAATAPLLSPQGHTTVGDPGAGGALQSALSGFGQVHAAGAAPEAPGVAPPRARHEMVVDSRGARGRKRARPAGAAGRRPETSPAADAEDDSSPEPPLHRPLLPPPLSPLSPRRSGDDPLPPPLSPLRPRAGAQQPAAAPKRAQHAPKPRKPAAAATPPPAPPPPSDAVLGRSGAVPLGKGRAKAAAPTAAAAPEAAPSAPAIGVTSAAHASVEAAAAGCTSEAGARSLLQDAARDSADAAAAVARGLASAALTRTVSPAALLSGVVAALRSAPACAPAVLELDACLAHARSSGRGGAVRLLGSGMPGGFADAVSGALHAAVMDAAAGRGHADPVPAAGGAVALLRARGKLAVARALLLDVLLHGNAAGGAASPLAAATHGALHAWPGLLAGSDPLAVAAAASLRTVLGDAAASASEAWHALQLPLLLADATPAAALELCVTWLRRCADGNASNDALHSAVRGLELLARHAGWMWAVQYAIAPHLLPLLQEEHGGAAGVAARTLAPLLLVGLAESEAAPGLADARQALAQALHARRGTLNAVGCAAAEAALEVAGRAPEGAALPELDAAAAWWDSLAPVLQSAAPARLARALRSAGLAAG